MTGPATYEIRVQGHLDDHWSDRLGGLGLTRNADGTTTLSGPLADQSELYGVLAGLRDIGAALLSVMLLSLADAAVAGASWEQEPGQGGEQDARAGR
jgi:hypothetical protein